jgi:cytochrome P450
MEFFRHVAVEQIRERQASGKHKQDFLQLLLDASCSNTASPQRRSLSENEILAQVVLFYSVGYETASQLLMYCVYCLALHETHQDFVCCRPRKRNSSVWAGEFS